MVGEALVVCLQSAPRLPPCLRPPSPLAPLWGRSCTEGSACGAARPIWGKNMQEKPNYDRTHDNHLNLNRCFAETTLPCSPPDINNLERSTTTQTWRQHYSVMQSCKVNHAERILPPPLHIQSVWAVRGGWGYSNQEIRVLGLWGKCVELWGWSAFL